MKRTRPFPQHAQATLRSLGRAVVAFSQCSPENGFWCHGITKRFYGGCPVTVIQADAGCRRLVRIADGSQWFAWVDVEQLDAAQLELVTA